MTWSKSGKRISIKRYLEVLNGGHFKYIYFMDLYKLLQFTILILMSRSAYHIFTLVKVFMVENKSTKFY